MSDRAFYDYDYRHVNEKLQQRKMAREKTEKEEGGCMKRERTKKRIAATKIQS